jgi:hypothetical protein
MLGRRVVAQASPCYTTPGRIARIARSALEGGVRLLAMIRNFKKHITHPSWPRFLADWLGREASMNPRAGLRSDVPGIPQFAVHSQTGGMRSGWTPVIESTARVEKRADSPVSAS